MLNIHNTPYFRTNLGEIYLDDSLHILTQMPDNCLDLIVTSPPFGLIKKKKYGNEDSANYLDWFKPFAQEFYRVLKPSGSLVIDIGGSWNKGTPTRSLYHFKFVVMLCEEFNFFLAQDFYWWNPSKLPTPAEWVTIRRIRAKDSVNTVWWLSKTEFPKASNVRVLLPYSDSMKDLLKNGYKAKERPSGHKISTKFSINNGGAIPSNLLAIANTESNDAYTAYCKENNITIHPARFPSELPEFFIRMLTNKDDIVYDPFGGSCVTGAVCERLGRRWICSELMEDYLKGAVGGRFGNIPEQEPNKTIYSIHNPSAAWGTIIDDDLPLDGGKNYKRAKSPNASK
jgi:site-specific DNA-methyltransferase (cytosine-N4-specific)